MFSTRIPLVVLVALLSGCATADDNGSARQQWRADQDRRSEAAETLRQFLKINLS